jgi:hypothetical protein
MTNKQRILQMVERWPDDIPLEKALYHMSVLRAIDEGLKDIEAGRTTDHDEVFDELERECEEEELAGLVDLLRMMAKRPALYLGSEDPDRAELWLSGFEAAVFAGPLSEEQSRIQEQVQRSRGWEVTATSSWRQMLERNLSPAEIITELTEIEIEFLTETRRAALAHANCADGNQ